MPIFTVSNLHVRVEDRLVLRGVNLALEPGQVYALMGPNGSGKSTMALALAGHPAYQIVQGQVLLDSQDILTLPAHARARAGLLVAFQYPPEVEGVRLREFLRLACAARGKFLRVSKGLSPSASALENGEFA